MVKSAEVTPLNSPRIEKASSPLIPNKYGSTTNSSPVNEKHEQQFTKLRVQNICCGKEATLVKNTLIDLPGILSVNINVIGRIAYVKHEPAVISTTQIIDKLNALHLGISLMESGQDAAAKENAKAKRWIWIRAASVITQTLLFCAIITATALKENWDKWVAIPILILGGAPMVYKAAIDVKRCVIANVNLLMLIAVTGTLVLREWLDGCLIVYVFSIAELLLMICYYNVEKGLSALLVSAPSTVLLAETNQSVDIKDVAMGTLIVVCAGEQIPLDGKVIKGKAAVDESSITGEATPVGKSTDSTVFSGTVIQSGYLKIETTSDYKTSTLSRVSEYIEEAKAASSNTEEILNRFAKFYTPLIVGVALLIFIVPLIVGKVKNGFTTEDMKIWSTRALKVLVVACPCSLIIAVPVTMISGISRASKDGILVKGAQFLEKMASIQMFCFDKTGTLTEGRFQVVAEHHVSGERSDAVMYAAALETKSSHPVAAAIVNHFSGCITDKIEQFGSQINLPDVTKFKNEAGMGLSGVVSEKEVLVGNLDLMQLYSVLVSDKEKTLLEDWSNMGRTVVFVANEGRLSLILGLADKVRDSSRETIQGLTQHNVRCCMLTGDTEGPARLISNETGIVEYSFSMKPHEKYEWLVSKQKQDKLKVAMCGDGVNDCPSLAAADVGIAIGPTATGLAVDSAGITLMSDDLSRVVTLLLLAKYCRTIVFQNIIGSIVIKVIFVAVALAKNGMLWLAIIADVTGLLFVIVNGIRPMYFNNATEKSKVVLVESMKKLEEKDGSKLI
uniref:P-type Cu(+) transporter n=1 Tax=Clytia hemisphaerica TaxID=252671 RepID=A0A7M5TRC8_9CNID